MTVAAPRYRQSYVEKDRCVRNSTAIKIPGVDVMQGFTLSKTEFETLFLQTAENMDDKPPTESRQKPRFRRKPTRKPIIRNAVPEPGSSSNISQISNPINLAEPNIQTAHDAADHADLCRKHAASLQRGTPADYHGAGEFFEKAVDVRAKYGLFCTPENADAHVEYAQNLSKRGLTPEAEYHLRCSADIYRMVDARSARKYGDVLLYLAVVIDRQGRLGEAENFYRSALAVYRKNKLSDDNVRVGIDSLSNNLRMQGRADEVDAVVKMHFLGALD